MPDLHPSSGQALAWPNEAASGIEPSMPLPLRSRRDHVSPLQQTQPGALLHAAASERKPWLEGIAGWNRENDDVKSNSGSEPLRYHQQFHSFT